MRDKIKGKPPLDLYQAVREIACRLDEVIEYLNNNDPAWGDMYVRTFNGKAGDVVGVSSVNGQTGDVTLQAGGAVESVNGKTGDVTLTGDDISLSVSDDQSISDVIGTLYGPDNAPPYPVTSVNTKTGAVEVKGSDISVSDNNDETVAAELAKKYDATNPPPYPVTSVNGQTGDVEISAGGGAVDSVNGKTGAVLLTASDINATAGGTVQQNIDTFSSGIEGLGNEVNTLQQDVASLETEVDGKYSSTNPPPYPVTSVNGKTGDITGLALAAAEVESLTLRDANGEIALFMGPTSAQFGIGSELKYTIYTTADPPPYPVRSVNGQTGDVTIASSGITYKGAFDCTISGSGSNRVIATFSGLSNYLGGNGLVLFKYRVTADSTTAIYFSVDGESSGFHTAWAGNPYPGQVEGSFIVPLSLITGTSVSVVSSKAASTMVSYPDGWKAYVYN